MFMVILLCFSLKVADVSLSESGHLVPWWLTSHREAALKTYWQSEDDAELCHYFYFPLADPSASEVLLIRNYKIMEAEIKARDVDCMKEHRNIFWYRGKQTKSMLTKYLDKNADRTNPRRE